MSLFRVTVTRWVDDAGKRVKAGTPGARKISKKSRKWYGEWTDEKGRTVRKPLSPNRTVAGQLLREALDAVERARVGWAPTPQTGAPAPPAPRVEDHLATYEAELASGVGRRRPSATHLAREIARLRRYLEVAGVTTPAGITLASARDFLSALGRDGEPVALPADQEEFTPAEVRALLGLSASAVTLLVRRHRISAHGKGRARRFPRSSVLELARRQARGAGQSTLHLYARTLRSFTRWLVSRGALAKDPLVELYIRVTEADRRKVRRALTVEELARLLAATRASAREFKGLDGPARWALYLTACATAFRAGALASLTPEDFDLPRPGERSELGAGGTVRLAANRNKSKRVKLQPLPPGVAELLRPWLATRPPGKTGAPAAQKYAPAAQALWPGAWVGLAADMLRADLEEASVPFALPSLDGPLEADFHALRHTSLTHLGQAGVELRTLQEFAGHSSPMLTARYSHRGQQDLEQAVLRFPMVAGMVEQITGRTIQIEERIDASGGAGPASVLPFPPREPASKPLRHA